MHSDFFTLALLKHIAALISLFNYVFRTLKISHTKFGKDWNFLEEVIGDIARPLRRTDRQTDRWTERQTDNTIR